MKLEKAIEILNQHQIDFRTPADHDFFRALLLGMAALGTWLECKRSYPHLPWPLLLGETID